MVPERMVRTWKTEYKQQLTLVKRTLTKEEGNKIAIIHVKY